MQRAVLSVPEPSVMPSPSAMPEIEVLKFPETSLIRVLLVEDDLTLRGKIVSFFELRDDCEIVGACATVRGALKACEESAVDLMVLNLRLLDREGWPFGETSVGGPSAVIALADSENRAFQAFEINAVDCVLRPGDRSRFERAFARARERIRTVREGVLSREILSRLESMTLPSKPADYLDEIVIKATGNHFFQKLKLTEVDWIEAEGNYIRLHCGKDSYLVRETVGNLETQIDPSLFTRIHRSVIVNLNRVLKWYPLFHGDYCVVLKDGTELTMSRRFRKNFKGF